MNWRNLEENDHGVFEVLSPYLPGVTEENKKKSVKMIGVFTEIRTPYLPNLRQKIYLLS
jgi:hypothetical protein